MSGKAADRVLAGSNATVRALNPHIFGGADLAAAGKDKTVSAAVRVRQEGKPLMNKLESDWFEYLRRVPEVKQETLRAQAKRYKLANGAWYKPDITAYLNGRETAWECKGPKGMKGMARGMLTIKVAAHQWPEVEFRLVWRENGQWHQQIIQP